MGGVIWFWFFISFTAICLIAFLIVREIARHIDRFEERLDSMLMEIQGSLTQVLTEIEEINTSLSPTNSQE